MIEVPVELSDRSYRVLVGYGLIAEVGVQVRAVLPKARSCAVVTDATVGPLYGPPVIDGLKAAGYLPTLVTVPAGEASKSLACVESVCRQMIRAGLDRSSFVVALGGGVIGDLAGFCAAIFFRGVPCIQIPTTVVSLVDSSVGGKTGVNTPEGKNLLGCFHQPRLVLADINTLATLPPRETNEGFAEIIKHAAIRDATMIPLIRRAQTEPALLPELVARNIAIKAAIVAADEHETTGLRALLNFGHTIGHGIEASAGYGQLLHGEAIALGLIAALQLSEQLAGLTPADSQSIRTLLHQYHLPQHLPNTIQTTDIIEKITRDKKFHHGAIRFILLRSLGDAFVSHHVTPAHLQSAIESLRA